MISQDPITLQAALRKLEAWRLNAPAARQRRFTRFPVRCQARIWPGEGNADHVHAATVHIRDVSRGGVGLLSSDPLVPGLFCQVQFVTDKVVITTSPAFCRHCREVTPQAYLLGLEFAVEAGLLMALGVPAKELSYNDEPEAHGPVAGQYIGPSALMEDEEDTRDSRGGRGI